MTLSPTRLGSSVIVGVSVEQTGRAFDHTRYCLVSPLEITSGSPSFTFVILIVHGRVGENVGGLHLLLSAVAEPEASVALTVTVHSVSGPSVESAPAQEPIVCPQLLQPPPRGPGPPWSLSGPSPGRSRIWPGVGAGDKGVVHGKPWLPVAVTGAPTSAPLSPSAYRPRDRVPGRTRAHCPCPRAGPPARHSRRSERRFPGLRCPQSR